MSDIHHLTKTLKTYLTAQQINDIQQAYDYAKKAHEGQTRMSGESYITHPLAVATILSTMKMDSQTLMAAMLHDVIEDSDITKEAISENFGSTVANLVDGVSKLTHIRFENRTHAQAKNFQKMSLALAKDIRVILVKLADRMHNMRTLDAMPLHKRQRKAKETLEIYAPIAQRLGMHNMAVEFEELSFFALYPFRAKLLKKAAEKTKEQRQIDIQQIISAVNATLQKNNLSAEIFEKEKHLYSVYCKMKEHRKSFSEITDTFIIRIITQSIDHCYRILGLIHDLYKPLPGHFKDYIANLKTNHYQALHTTLFGPRGLPIEIQICTKKMEAIANHGITAHWQYKKQEDALAVSHHHNKGWIQDLLELQQTSINSKEFIESVKTNLFPDEVYVFTPQGDIKALPQGATPIDFAYAVHTNIGHKCIACRINRRLASLNQPLENGQTVEIIISDELQPHHTWLNFTVSMRARSRIQHFLQRKKKNEYIHLGEQLLTHTLKQMGLPIKTIELLDEKQLSSLLKKFKFTTKEGLFEDVGLGNIMSYTVVNYIIRLLNSPTQKNISIDQSSFLVGQNQTRVVTFSSCCCPIPGDNINGYLKSGYGIIIHRSNCKKQFSPYKKGEILSNVGWDDKLQSSFLVKLHLSHHPDKMLLLSIATIAYNLNAEVLKITFLSTETQIQQTHIFLKVQHRVHLAKIIKKLRHIPCILSIVRP